MLIGFNRVNSTKTKESSVDKKQTSITFSKPCESSTNRNSPYFRFVYRSMLKVTGSNILSRSPQARAIKNVTILVWKPVWGSYIRKNLCFSALKSFPWEKAQEKWKTMSLSNTKYMFKRVKACNSFHFTEVIMYHTKN